MSHASSLDPRRIAPAAVKAIDRMRRGRATRTDMWWVDPTKVLLEAGYEADDWQQEVLGCVGYDVLLNASRQCGKTFVTSAKAILTAVLEGPALVLILSRSLRQAGELFRAKLVPLYERLKRPVLITRETALQLELANGSRIVSLPGNEETVRGFSDVKLLILDEASRIPDVLFRSVRPMLAVSGGRCVALSTPWGRRGWFYHLAEGENRTSRRWRRWTVPWTRCPRMTRSFIDDERATHGDAWVAQEYENSFNVMSDAAFAEEVLKRAVAEGTRDLVL